MIATVHDFNSLWLQQFVIAAVRDCNSSWLQQFMVATVYDCSSSWLQQFLIATIHEFIWIIAKFVYDFRWTVRVVATSWCSSCLNWLHFSSTVLNCWSLFNWTFCSWDDLNISSVQACNISSEMLRKIQHFIKLQEIATNCNKFQPLQLFVQPLQFSCTWLTRFVPWSDMCVLPIVSDAIFVFIRCWFVMF